jgi:ectoine hydroxylase-related dioxygenase (phytanoyl-CoA dioxygenase family)
LSGLTEAVAHPNAPRRNSWGLRCCPAADDASLHTGWTFHGARPNATDRDRLAMTVIYLPDGTRLIDPTAGQTFDRRAWVPDSQVGEPIDSWLNPVVWAADSSHVGTLDRLPPLAAMVGTFTIA